MISRKVLGKLEAMGWEYILGTGLRRTAEVKNRVLQDNKPFQVVAWTPRKKKRNGEVKEKEPKLEVKEVVVKTDKPDGSVVSHRYVVCRNPAQARREAANRADLVAKLPGMLRDQGAKTLLKNRSIARLLKARKGAYVLDREELAEAPKYDGIWVLRTNTELDPKDVALRYKQLWMVERTFRTAKSILNTRPVFHQTAAAIRGHLFCSFLALTLQKALYRPSGPGRGRGKLVRHQAGPPGGPGDGNRAGPQALRRARLHVRTRRVRLPRRRPPGSPGHPTDPRPQRGQPYASPLILAPSANQPQT